MGTNSEVVTVYTAFLLPPTPTYLYRPSGRILMIPIVSPPSIGTYTMRGCESTLLDMIYYSGVQGRRGVAC